jgi:hypothetical protein
MEITRAMAMVTRQPITLYQRNEIFEAAKQEMTATSPTSAPMKTAVPRTRLK